MPLALTEKMIVVNWISFFSLSVLPCNTTCQHYYACLSWNFRIYNNLLLGNVILADFHSAYKIIVLNFKQFLVCCSLPLISMVQVKKYALCVAFSKRIHHFINSTLRQFWHRNQPFLVLLFFGVCKYIWPMMIEELTRTSFKA